MRIAVFASRPWVQTLVMRKTFSRQPLASAFPMRVSLTPSWYSQALSMKVMPASMARWQERRRLTLGADLAEMEAAESEGGHGLAGAAEWAARMDSVWA
jgi:hypothetical protein